MSQDNHTPLSTGAAAQAATFNAVFSQLDSAIRKNNFAATAAPGVGDDTADGYTVGSRWIDVTNDRSYVAVDVTLGAAIWQETSVPNTMRVIDSSGRVIIGHTAGINSAGINTKLQTYSATTSAASVAGATHGQFSADTRGAQINLSKSRTASIALGTVVQNGDTLGTIKFNGDDGTLFSTGAEIKALVNGTPGGTDMPTELQMLVSADGSATPTLSLAIKPTRSVVLNNAAIATTATDGFLYIAACAGVPTGVPTTFTGRIPIVIDSTNNKMYIYSGGSWVALN